MLLEDSISKKTKIPLDEFLIAFQMVLNSIVFIFNKKIYKQNIWDLYGITLVTVIANMIMQDFKEITIEMLPVRLLFYYRYVDDIILFRLRVGDTL